MSARRQLHLNAFLMSSGHHEAAWRLPQSDPSANLDLGHWQNLAQIAERGRFDSLFLADGRRGLFRTEYAGSRLRDHYGLPRPGSQFAAGAGRSPALSA